MQENILFIKFICHTSLSSDLYLGKRDWNIFLRPEQPINFQIGSGRCATRHPDSVIANVNKDSFRFLWRWFPDLLNWLRLTTCVGSQFSHIPQDLWTLGGRDKVKGRGVSWNGVRVTHWHLWKSTGKYKTKPWDIHVV